MSSAGQEAGNRKARAWDQTSYCDIGAASRAFLGDLIG
jgi:hypothetical protein